MKRARLRRFWPYLRPFSRSIALLFASVLVTILINLPTPWCEKVIIDEALPRGDLRLLALMLAVILGLFAVYRLVLFLRGYLSVRIRQRALTHVRMHMYRHLQRMSLGYFSKNPTGGLLSRLTNDVGFVQNLLNDELFEMIGSVVKVLITIGLLFAISIKLTLFCMGVLPVVAMVFFLLKRSFYARSLELQQMQQRLSGQIQQSFSGMKVIQAEVAEQRMSEETLATSKELEGVAIRREVIAVVGNLLTTLFSYLPMIAILWGIGGMMVIEKTLTLGALLAYTQYVMGLVNPLTRLFQFNMNLQAGYAALDRIYEILDEKPEITDAPGAQDLAGPVERIAFRRVTLEFAGPAAPGEGRGAVAALRDVSFSIKRGEKVALVGPNGSGKTSVLHLLLRFYDATRGQVLINDRPVQDYTLSSLRLGLAYLPQEVFLFGSSIRKNLSLRGSTGDQALLGALQLAGAEQLVRRAEGGLGALVDERGANLSGGERQRLALARLVAREADLFLLDEATSAMDPATEQQVLVNLRQFFQGKTAILVVHRYALLELADRILVFSSGRLVEQGGLHELLKRRGMFYALHQSQLT